MKWFKTASIEAVSQVFAIAANELAISNENNQPSDIEVDTTTKNDCIKELVAKMKKAFSQRKKRLNRGHGDKYIWYLVNKISNTQPIDLRLMKKGKRRSRISKVKDYLERIITSRDNLTDSERNCFIDSIQLFNKSVLDQVF